MWIRLLSCWVLFGQLAFSVVVRVEFREQSSVLAGSHFSLAGRFERLEGKVFFEIDPRLPQNQMICDIQLAPKNNKGKVAFSSDFYLLKPIDRSKSNGTILYEVSNRGRKGMLDMFNLAESSLDPTLREHFGDGFLLNRGFTLAWLGWQFDVPQLSNLLKLYTPISQQGSKPVRGLVRAEFVPKRRVLSFSLADRNMRAVYPVARPQDPKLKLTVRDLTDGPRRVIARHRWSFAREDDGKPVASRNHVFMPSGFEPGRIYELVYKAENPNLVGLGLAATRDFISFLKYGRLKKWQASEKVLGNLATRAIGFGSSQSGRFLRPFLYYGLNQDERSRQVFDGVLSHVAGASRGSFNHRFAQPSRDAHAFMNTFYPTVIYPFADLAQFDDETGLREGILSRSQRESVIPKIFYTNASYEYYGRAASLIHTSLDGSRDISLAKNTRIYVFAGSQHGPATFPPRRSGTINEPNFNDFRWSMRALILALNRWLVENIAPPNSKYPQISKGELVSLSDMQFRKIPGIQMPVRIMQPYRLNYGFNFRTHGIATIQPPLVGKAFRALVPQVNRDGNEIAGIRLPIIQVPLATYSGWNLRHPRIGAPEELYSMVGSFIPFPKTREDRLKSGDPRHSIATRYTSREDYLNRIKVEARRVVNEGFLIRSDVPQVVKQASALWDYLISQ